MEAQLPSFPPQKNIQLHYFYLQRRSYEGRSFLKFTYDSYLFREVSGLNPHGLSRMFLEGVNWKTSPCRDI